MSGLDVRQLDEHIIRPTIRSLAKFFRPHQRKMIDSESAVQLLLGIAAHESGGFRYLVQVGGGPARGLWQMEPIAKQHVYDYLDGGSWHALRHYLGAYHPQDLTLNLGYSCAMARLYLWTAPEALPAPTDIDGMAAYWHTYWCRGCAGTPSQYKKHYAANVAAYFPTEKPRVTA